MGKQRRARLAGVPELQLAVDAAAAAAAAFRCVATANRSGGSAVQRWQSDPTSASLLLEALAAAAQSAIAYTRLAERCRAVPGGAVRRLAGVTANAVPVQPAGAAAPAGSSRTTRRAAQRRRQRQRGAAAAAAKPPQAAPAKAGAVSGDAERQPPAGRPRTWAAAVAASPPAPRTAAPGGAPPLADVSMKEVVNAGAASAASPTFVFGAGSGGGLPPSRGTAGRTQGRAQPAAAALWGGAAAAAAGGRGGRTGERTPAQRPLRTTPAPFRDPFARRDVDVGVVRWGYNDEQRHLRRMEGELEGLGSDGDSEASWG